MPSSVVAKTNYEPGTLILRVVYISGDIYEYENVPAEVYDAMRSSFSKGTFLNTEIKGKYNYRKLS